MGKIRESGMPDESMWAGFFKPQDILGKLGLTADCGDVVEFGCGYGTFTIPAARIISGKIYALDIESAMIDRVRYQAEKAGLGNIVVSQRDFVAHGTGLAKEICDYAMLFNILHAENPVRLLRETFRVLRPGGKLGVIHWVHASSTPRGPSMSIRPTPERCREWGENEGFRLLPSGVLDLPPYHYGMVFRKEGRILGEG